jgi:hypothetical protein
MSISRRRFVRTATLSALAGAALRSAWAKPGAAAADETFSPENLVALNGISMQTFERLAGESFTVSSGDRTLGSMTLLSVTAYALPPASPVKGRLLTMGTLMRTAVQPLSSFSVRFQGSGAVLPQGTYTIANSSIGSMPLLLVPSGPNSSPNTYTAVFNLLMTPGARVVPLQKEAILAPVR